MLTAAVRHLSFYPFVQPLARTRARFVLKAAAGDMESGELIWWKRTEPENRRTALMHLTAADSVSALWQTETDFPEEAHYIKYVFRLTDTEKNTVFYNACGFHTEITTEGSFEILQLNETDLLSVPDWSRGCIYYQIFPERFARCGKAESDFDPWNAAPTRDNYLGGNLKGIKEKLPYLKDLGIECLYLNPVFEGDFNHKYATTDYMKIDPLFGTENDLCDLVAQAHQLGLRVILDGVFNHSGIHFAPFEDLMKNGEKSRYAGWFYPKKYPLRISADYYECVGDYPYMPRLNGADPGVRAYVRDVLLYWPEHAHIDGWRFDVADELDRHAVTWWREELKKRFPDCVMLCETWGDASRMLGPDCFDTAMNYLFRDAAVDYFARGTITAEEFSDRLNGMLIRYPEEINQAMYNCLGSHDTARFLTEASGEKWRLMLAMAFQMLFPGAPAIYYGDEIGMTGENDPGCRGGMAWDSADTKLLDWQKELISLRKRHPALRYGKYTVLAAKEDLFAFERRLGSDCVTVIFNTAGREQQTDFTGAAETVHIPPHSVKIIE